MATGGQIVYYLLYELMNQYEVSLSPDCSTWKTKIVCVCVFINVLSVCRTRIVTSESHRERAGAAPFTGTGKSVYYRETTVK